MFVGRWVTVVAGEGSVVVGGDVGVETTFNVENYVEYDISGNCLCCWYFVGNLYTLVLFYEYAGDRFFYLSWCDFIHGQ